MAKIEDCPGFETFGADVKAARKAKQLSRSALADMIHCDSRYLVERSRGLGDVYKRQEEYLPIVEGAIDGALRIHEQEKVPACV